MADPVTVTCGAACTVTVVHELSLPPLQLTLEEGGLITLAIVSIWAIGFAFRSFIRAADVDKSQSSDGSERD